MLSSMTEPDSGNPAFTDTLSFLCLAKMAFSSFTVSLADTLLAYYHDGILG